MWLLSFTFKVWAYSGCCTVCDLAHGRTSERAVTGSVHSRTKPTEALIAFLKCVFFGFDLSVLVCSSWWWGQRSTTSWSVMPFYMFRFIATQSHTAQS